MRARAGDTGPCRIVEAGAELTVRVTPKASRTAFAGLLTLPDGRRALAVRVAAPPVDGAANAALLAFLAKQIDTPKRDVAIVSGEGSRLKAVRVTGDGPGIVDRVRQVTGADA